MNLVTDRTREDVLVGNDKGRYSPGDLDRVERMVQELCRQMELLDIHLQLSVFTRWYQTRNVPTRETMKRYLGNVRSVSEHLDLSAELPESMENLDWQGANRIEQALQKAQEKIRSVLQTYQMSGELFAGEENGI